MYCKQCGHRSDEKTETCKKCGAKITSTAEITAPAPRGFRWRGPVIAVVAALGAFVVLPRFFLQQELDSIGPTDKLRFLRALENSQYKRAGQNGFRVESETLTI